MNFISSILPAIEHFHTIGYWIALLAALLETTLGIGLLVPGSTIILLMGGLAAKGYFDLGDLLWFAAIGAILGDNLNYFIGKKYGSKFSTKGFWFIKPAHLKKGEDFFRKHGPKSVFIGRFVPGLKEIIPTIAGTFKMKRLVFMIWNIAGAIGWSLAWVLPGYFFAQSLNFAETWLTRAGFFLAIILAALFILYILKIIIIKYGKKFFSFLFSILRSIKQAVIENPEVQKFTGRHKTFFQFMQRRLDKSRFSGLPLTLLSLALLYVLSLFGGIIKDIITSDIIVSADIRAANLLAIFRNTGLTNFFLWITMLGKWQVVAVFTISTALILWIWGERSYIIPLLISIAGSEIFTLIGKSIIQRARPDVAVYLEKSSSFPSGHAAIAVAFYGFISYILIRNRKQWSKKINAFFAGLIIIMLVGFSRLYLGVHYASDVWGGYLTGAIWLIIGISLAEFLSYKKYPAWISPIRKKRLATAGIAIATVGLYATFTLNHEIPAATVPQKTGQITINNAAAIFNNDQSRYTETLLGNRQEPISFTIIAENDRQLTSLFEQSGWALADKATMKTIIKMTHAAIWKESYPRAPMSPYFWNANVHDFGFEKATGTNNVRTRHHARFWKTNYITENGDTIYVGTVSLDSGIKWGITHKIAPDIDTEREFLLGDMKKTGLLAKIEKRQSIGPKLGNNFFGDPFFTDGKSYLLSMKTSIQ